MKIAVWMVVRSYSGIEEYYISMAIESVVNYVDAIYIQDQGCEDQTIQVAKETVRDRIPLVIESVPTNLPRFDKAYNEPFFRSQALKRAEEIFKPDFLLKCDADDMYTPDFFKTVKQMEESGELSKYNSIRHSSERFITPEWRSQSKHAKQIFDGLPFYDPHIHFWRSGLGIHFVKNPGMGGSFFHCVLNKEPIPILCLPGIHNIHLHRSFGNKAFKFWAEGGDEFEETTPFCPEKQAPKWFRSQLNMGQATYTPYPWPEYIKDKWRKWGEYPGYDWDRDRSEEYKEYCLSTFKKKGA